MLRLRELLLTFAPMFSWGWFKDRLATLVLGPLSGFA